MYCGLFVVFFVLMIRPPPRSTLTATLCPYTTPFRSDLCAGGQPINAMLEHVFLWCRDRRIYGPSRKELERLVRSQRHLYLEALFARVRDRLAPDAVALLEASLADPDGPTGFNTMKGDAGQATLENILGVTAKLAFIQRLALPRDFLSVTGKAWVDQIVRRVAGEKASEMRRHVTARLLGPYAVYLRSEERRVGEEGVRPCRAR